MKHIVVKDIKSETKVFKFIYIQDFFETVSSFV